MDKTPKVNAAIGDESLVLAKILLRKFDILHDFHVHQLQRYLIACCPSSMGGEVSINAEMHLVQFEIKTSFLYKRIKGKIVPRHKFSVIKIYNSVKHKQKYQQEIELAQMSLNSWTKELLWGNDTTVKVIVDGIPL